MTCEGKERVLSKFGMNAIAIKTIKKINESGATEVPPKTCETKEKLVNGKQRIKRYQLIFDMVEITELFIFFYWE